MLIRAPVPRQFIPGDALDLNEPLLWTVDGVLSPDECRALIERIEAIGPKAAPITTAHGFEHRPDIRNNTRVMLDDPDLAEDLYLRVADTLPRLLNIHYRPVGANERFRFYRYEVGQRFAMHYDGAFERNDREQSLLTLMVYLNEGFEGGTTYFPDHDVSVIPQTGRALLFQHGQLHEGRAVDRGVKYALRTDVMYRG